MNYSHGQSSLIALLAALITFTLWDNLITFISFYYITTFHLYWIQLLNYRILCLLAKKFYRTANYDILARSFFLGFTFCLGLKCYTTKSENWKIFGAYVAALTTFHYTEFLAIAFANPAASSADTFLINHSAAYTIAVTASWIEYVIELHYFPNLKQNLYITLIGLILCAIGEFFRKTAIFTAKQNFNHIIQDRKAAGHTLVKHGVYKLCRHPSYVGWFYWSIGTQLLLQNPVCLFIYILATWKFFSHRIYIEELHLIYFFGNSYIKYQSEVGTGLPFIKGYTVYIPS